MLLDFQSSIAIILNLSHDSLCASKQSLCDFYMGTTMDLPLSQRRILRNESVIGRIIFQGTERIARQDLYGILR